MINQYDLEQGWQDHDTLKKRRLYLIDLIEYFSQGKIIVAKLKPGGFQQEASHLFWPSYFDDNKIQAIKDFHYKVVEKVNDLPNNIIFKSNHWLKLENYMKSLSREFKIHLQPQEHYIPLVMARLIELLSSDNFLLENIIGLKVAALFPAKYLYENRATIVVYLDHKAKRQETRLICQQALLKLKTGLADYEQYAENRLPIYNFPLTDLISFIQVGTDAKFRLKKVLGHKRFNILFPQTYYQALLMDEDPQFYVPATTRQKIVLPKPQPYQLPDLNKFPLPVKRVTSMIDVLTEYEYCCPHCHHEHSFKCGPVVWPFDCENCLKDSAPCQTVMTQQGEIQVFVCKSCSRPYRIYDNDQEYHSIKIID